MRISLKSLPGIGFCLCAAALLSLVLNNDEDVRLVAPVMCLFIVIATAFHWGRMAAILGGSVASLIFSIFLFPPLGSIRVSSPADRTALLLFELSVIGVSFLSPPRYPKTGE